MISKNASRDVELNYRLSFARVTAVKLRMLWRKAEVPLIWKLQVLVFSSVVISQLLYALDSLHITKTNFRKLDAFHQRGLRYVLNILPPHIPKVSNENILKMANTICHNQKYLFLPT